MHDELMLRVRHFTESLPLLPEWSAYLNEWAQKMRIEEEFGVYKLFLNSENFIEIVYNSSMCEKRILNFIVSFCEEIRRTGERRLPPTNIVISMMLQIGAVFGEKQITMFVPNQCYSNKKLDNYVYILPQHSISYLEGVPGSSWDKCVPFSSLVPGKWSYYSSSEHIIEDGKIPFEHYADKFITTLCRAQLKVAFRVFFYNQPLLYENVLKFINQKNSIWGGKNGHVVQVNFSEFSISFSSKERIVKVHASTKTFPFISESWFYEKEWREIAPIISRYACFWNGESGEHEKLYFLLRWVCACYMQNSYFLHSGRYPNQEFPKVTDDFSDPECVKGTLGELFVPASTSYYLAILQLIESMNLDKNVVKIIQDYFNDMLFNIPSVDTLSTDVILVKTCNKFFE